MDQFTDYSDRGDRFARAVRHYLGGDPADDDTTDSAARNDSATGVAAADAPADDGERPETGREHGDSALDD